MQKSLTLKGALYAGGFAGIGVAAGMFTIGLLRFVSVKLATPATK